MDEARRVDSWRCSGDRETRRGAAPLRVGAVMLALCGCGAPPGSDSGASSDALTTGTAAPTGGETTETPAEGTAAPTGRETTTETPAATTSGTTDDATGPALTTGGGEIPPGSTIPVGGSDHFLLGANYPWLTYGGDFGGNAWGVYGVHTRTGDVGAHFDQLAGYQARVVRWFVFTDGRAGISFDADGVPTGLGEHVLEDMQAAVALARERGLYLVPVLFDFHWMFWAKQDGGVQLGGRSATITDAARRTALVEDVVTPLLQAFADEPAILAWEIMNEPEWSIADLPAAAPNGEADAVPLADFYAFAAATADAVHAHTSAYATLGSASLKWHRVWTPAFAAAHGLPTLALDFYQTHYYPWMDGQSLTDDPELGTVQLSPMVQPCAALDLDRPMVVGEFILSDQAAARLDVLLANGYAGAWPWSLTSDYSLDGPGLAGWAASHAALVDLPAP